MSSSEDNVFETGDNNRLPGIAATTDFDEDHGLHPSESNKAGRIDQSNVVAITRRIVQDTIADMNLDPAAEAEVIEAFTGAGLL
jgi:hypothetical protein